MDPIALNNAVLEVDSQLYKQKINYQRDANRLNREVILLKTREWRNNNRAKMREYQIRRVNKDPERDMVKRAKARALKSGLPFDISKKDIRIPSHCPVLGIELKRGGNNGFSPSLDRIENAKGYVKGNVHVISKRANTIKSNATLEELVKVANYFLILDKARKRE